MANLVYKINLACFKVKGEKGEVKFERTFTLDLNNIRFE